MLIYLDTTKPLIDVFLHKPLKDGYSLLAQPDWI